MRLSKLYFSLILYFCIFNNIQAQVTAKFIAIKPTSGCAPLVVDFQDQSTGNIISREWYFGDGTSNTSGNLTLASRTYQYPGQYTVTLKVSDGINTDTYTQTNFVTVFKNPDANFITTSTISGCVPLSVNFQSTSTPGDAAITQFAWNFADGSLQSTSNTTISHTYTSAGYYDVSLKVTDANGCFDTIKLPNTVRASSLPIISFTQDQNFGCNIPFDVAFTNNTSTFTGQNYTCSWDFGNGNTSTNKNPTTTYNAFGNYTIKLTVTDSNGCSNSVNYSNYVQIAPVDAAFETHLNSFSGPIKDTICPGSTIYFTNISTGANSYLWDLGTGSYTTSSANPVKLFSTPGIYTIKLIASKGLNCKDTLIRTIVVDDVSGTMSFTPKYVCQAPADISFSGTSNATSGVQNISWDFGDGSVSGLSNTIHTYYSGGIFPITYSITSKAGCTKTYNSTMNVSLMDASFTQNKDKGCEPLTVTFSSTSTPKDTIVLYKWIFGDGITAGPGAANSTVTGAANTTGTYLNPVHTYLSEGEYDVTLIVFNAFGCSDTLLVQKAVKVGIKPTANFGITPQIACASETIQFSDSTNPTTKIDEWFWSFGDTLDFPGVLCSPFYSTGTSTDQNPTYNYTDTGYMQVTLIAGYRGCYDTLVVDSAIYIKGPYAKIRACLDCKTPFNRSFDGIMIGADRYYWNLGDGSPIDSINQSLTHIYPSNNNYKVLLTTYNDASGCSFVDSVTVYIKDIEANFSIDKYEACYNTDFLFNAGTSQDVATSNGYTWDFGDGVISTSSSSTITHAYSSPGTYPVKLIARDMHGCEDTIIQSIKVYRPVVDFTSNVSGGCVPLSVVFTDLTQTQAPVSLRSWKLDEGFTSSDSITSSIQYTLVGSKNITLIVTDTKGCIDSLTKPAFIKLDSVSARIFPTAQIKICAGKNANFIGIPYSTNGTQNQSYLWDFGNGNTSTLLSPSNINFPDSGKFTVKFTVTDIISGCSLTATSNNLVDVQAVPDVQFYADKLIIPCYPDTIKLIDTTGLNYISSWKWDTDGKTYYGNSPYVIYDKPGTYDVSLILTTSYNCKDTLIKSGYIQVNGPIAEIGILKDTICYGETVKLFPKNHVNAYHLIWDFGEGNQLNTLNPDTVSHAYYELNWLKPVLVYFAADSTCKKAFSGDSILVYGVTSNFSVSDYSECENQPINFTNLSTGNDPSEPDNINDNLIYQWNIDGAFSSSTNETKSFADFGTKQIQLITRNNFGCTDTTNKTININPQPLIDAGSSQKICEGDSINLYSKGTGSGITYLWDNENTLNNPNIAEPTAFPTEEITNYTVIITSDSGCVNSASLIVTLNLLPVISIGSDTTIVIGDTLSIIGYANYGTYQWTPSTGLSCTDCPNPIAKPENSTTYYVTVNDTLGCGSRTDSITITIKKEFNLAVPNAFTPYETTNNIISVKGWGIKQLLEFTIYNRWGQVVFQTNNINEGWDGYFNGVMQNTETYIYIVKALMYDGKNEPTIKKGNITLLR